MSTQSNKMPNTQAYKSSSEPSALNERQEHLLVKFSDNELSVFGRYKARRLLASSAQAQNYLEQIYSLRSALNDVTYSKNADLWDRIDAAIDNEEFAQKVLLPQNQQTSNRPHYLNWITDSVRQVSWGACGVAVTAGLLAVGVRFGQIPMPKNASNFGAVTQATQVSNSRSHGNTASEIYILNDHAQPAMEVDWMRSAGSVRVIPDVRDRNTILWVKRAKRGIINGNTVSSENIVPSAIPQLNN